MIRALLVGGNYYPDHSSWLQNCDNDIQAMETFLRCRGVHDVRKLTNYSLTKSSLRETVRVLAEQTQPGDTIFLYYTGHGTWMPDSDGDEIDARDECLYLCSGEIATDDELHLMTMDFPYDCNIVGWADSCFSGGIRRTLAKGRRKAVFPPVTPYPRLLNTPIRYRIFEKSIMKAARSGIAFSGCGPNEFSFDGYYDQPNGAMTAVGIKVYQDGMTYREWHSEIRSFLPDQNYPQSPELDGTAELMDQIAFL